MKYNNVAMFEQASLDYHSAEPHGKTAIRLTKSLHSPHDMSLAYTPGVAAPCRAIAMDGRASYRYTNRGNLVAVVTNGTALLGLGNLGPLAAKPVMEGKAMLLKALADIDSFDIELDEADHDRIIDHIRALATGFGAILLEDIKAPECFYIERRLKELLTIPVLHDDQHATAVVVAAAVINATKLTHRSIESLRTVICGAGAAAIATAKMLVSLGVQQQNLVMCDSLGVITADRPLLSDYKRKFATTRPLKSLQEAVRGADLFIGAAKGNLLTGEMVLTMADNPIVLALSNPTPELDPEVARTIRPDLIYATGRSDLENQVNNALAAPYLFRAALDTEASTINEEMLLAAAEAIATLAEWEVPQEVAHTYNNKLHFGPHYLLPKINDRRLLSVVTPAVAEAAIRTGVARRSHASREEYLEALERRMEHAEKVLG